LESTKAVLQGEDAAKKANTLAVIDLVLSHVLRLFHPFLPFISEELWHGIGYSEDMPADQGGKTLMSAPWPKPFDAEFRDFYSLDDCYLEFVEAKHELVTIGRNLRREANIASNKKVSYILKREDGLPPHDLAVLKLLLNAEAFTVQTDYEPKKGTLSARAEMGELYLPTEGLIDVTAEVARLTKLLESYQVEIEKVRSKLANPAFTQKAPPTVLEEHQKRLLDWQAKLAHTQKALEALRGS
jgi:valyl-tRNA synthetase